MQKENENQSSEKTAIAFFATALLLCAVLSFGKGRRYLSQGGRGLTSDIYGFRTALECNATHSDISDPPAVDEDQA